MKGPGPARREALERIARTIKGYFPLEAKELERIAQEVMITAKIKVFGYDPDGSENETEQRMLRVMIDLRKAAGLSYQKIAKAMQDRGMPMPATSIERILKREGVE